MHNAQRVFSMFGAAEGDDGALHGGADGGAGVTFSLASLCLLVYTQTQQGFNGVDERRESIPPVTSVPTPPERLDADSGCRFSPATKLFWNHEQENQIK